MEGENLMLRLWLVPALCLCWLARPALAVFENVSSAEENVRARMEREAQETARPEVLRQQEEERQEAARVRADRIRRLPPGKVAEWAEGRLSEEDLESLSASKEDSDDASEPVSVEIPRDRMVRLMLCGALVCGLAGVLWYRRRRECITRAAGGRQLL